MKNKNIWLNRGLSLLLVFMMIFSMMPMSTFAVGNNSESENQDTNEMSGDTYLVKTTKFFGWRFSLYFAEGVNNEADITSSTEFVPLGQIETNILMSIYPPTYWTEQNVYDRMGYADDTGMNETRLSKVDYKSKITTTSDLPILSSIPKVYEDGVVKKGDLNKFFMGTADYDFDNPTDEQKKNLDFKNTITIANYILAKNNLGKIPYDKSKDIDGYRDGCYIDVYGVTHRGVLKLHYEPILNYKIKGKYFAMSLRDIITYINAHPDYNLVKNGSDGYYGYIPSGVLMQGKMVYLVRPEPHLRNMGTASTDFGDSKKNV